MNMQNFTEKSLEALRSAQGYAREYGNQTLECEHLLLALLKQENGLIGEVLKKANIKVDGLTKDTEDAVSRLVKVMGAKGDNIYMSATLDSALSNAEAEAKNMGDSFISVEHIFLGLISKTTSNTKKLFDTCLSIIFFQRFFHKLPRCHPHIPFERIAEIGLRGEAAFVGNLR